MEYRKECLKDIKRIVVKVGTSTLAYPNGRMNIQHVDMLVKQLADLSNRGLEVLLVTSGAIGAGLGRMNKDKRPGTIPEKQAAAAIGQGILLHMYEKLFSEYGITVAQILLTKEDMSDRNRFLNARNVLFQLLKDGVIPIINENDTIAIDEIKFGDNDTLSAIVAGTVEADLLVLLSDIDCLYDADPRKNPDARPIGCVESITPEIENMAGGAGTSLGTGGMATKIKAARIATASGTAMVIARGDEENIITEILIGKEKGTWFKPMNHPMLARKRWIAFGQKIKGKLTIDEGAEKAIIEGSKSLLPGGVVSIEGSFQKGDEVLVLNSAAREIARGLVNYNSRETKKIKGLKSGDIEEVLGYRDYDELIHRDNMVILR
jgi:glutamate 5-kinase